ncbi:MAG: hypothetical protein NTY77_07565 [Elusimicrobia bacterium]|nr:hypothetical protein [Elusimicrobiota bacterium]
MSGCETDPKAPRQLAKPDAAAREASRCVVREGLVVSIDGIPINYPDSEKLNWTKADDADPADPRLVPLGAAHANPPTTAHTLRVDRFTTIGTYALLCGRFEPPFPDGSFNWVVDKSAMEYVGHFLDKESR